MELICLSLLKHLSIVRKAEASKKELFEIVARAAMSLKTQQAGKNLFLQSSQVSRFDLENQVSFEF